jgi:hypothetical protein
MMLNYSKMKKVRKDEIRVPARMVLLRPDGTEILPANGKITYCRPTDKIHTVQLP